MATIAKPPSHRCDCGCAADVARMWDTLQALTQVWRSEHPALESEEGIPSAYTDMVARQVRARRRRLRVSGLRAVG